MTHRLCLAVALAALASACGTGRSSTNTPDADIDTGDLEDSGSPDPTLAWEAYHVALISTNGDYAELLSVTSNQGHSCDAMLDVTEAPLSGAVPSCVGVGGTPCSWTATLTYAPFECSGFEMPALLTGPGGVVHVGVSEDAGQHELLQYDGTEWGVAVQLAEHPSGLLAYGTSAWTEESP